MISSPLHGHPLASGPRMAWQDNGARRTVIVWLAIGVMVAIVCALPDDMIPGLASFALWVVSAPVKPILSLLRRTPLPRG